MSFVTSFSDSPSWIAFAIDVSIKVSLLFTVAALTTTVLRRFSAAVCHRIWTLAFCGALLIPILTTLVPQWEFPILPHSQTNSEDNLNEFTERQDVAAIEYPAQEPSGQENLATDSMVQTTVQNTMTSIASQQKRISQETQAKDLSRSIETMESEPETASALELPLDVVWVFGFIVSCVPLIIGIVQKRLLLKKAQEINRPIESALLQQLCENLGVSRSVRLLELDVEIVPMTWGILRPVILLPESCVTWSRQRLRIVLIHELAHVKRFDFPCQILARLACNIYWFNPLIWFGLGRFRSECELACDDCVTNVGVRASDYASELVEIAETHRAASMVASVALSRTTGLEDRIRSLFDRTKSHSPLTRSWALGLSLATSGLILFAAVIHPVEGNARENDTTLQRKQDAGGSPEKSLRKTTDALGDPLPSGALLRLGTMRFRHPSSATEMTLSPDGKTIVTYGGRKLIVWDAITGKEKWRAKASKTNRNLPAASYGIRSVAFTPDSQKFYATGPKSEVILWDVDTGHDSVLTIVPANPQANSFRSIDVTPDGKTLAFGSSDGLVVIDHDGKKLYEIANNPKGVLAAAGIPDDRLFFGGHYSMGRFSPDGKILAVTTSDTPKIISLHDAKTGNEVRRIKLKSWMVRMTFSPDSKQIVATERDQAVRLYDVGSGKEVWSHFVKLTNIYENYTSAVAFSPNGKIVAACATDNRIYFFHAATGKEMGRLTGSGGYPWALAFTADSKILFSSGWDGIIRRWDVAARKQLPLPQGVHATDIAASSPDGQMLAYSDDSGTIRIVNAKNGMEQRKLSLPGTSHSQVVFSPESNRLAGGGTSGDRVHVAVWDVVNGQLLHRWDWPKGRDPHSLVNSLCFTPDGKRLAAAVFRQSSAYVWNLTTDQRIAHLAHRSVYGLSFSPDGKTLATAGWDSIIRFWETETGKLRREHKVKNALGGKHDLRMYAVCYAPAGGLLATAHMDGTVLVWHADGMKQRTQFSVGERFIFGAISFSPDGLWLATGSVSGRVALWDPLTAEKVWDYGKHQSYVYTVGFGRDSRTLLSGGSDGVSYLWDLRPPKKQLEKSPARLWSDLTNKRQSLAAYKAIWELSKTPNRTVMLMGEKLKLKKKDFNVKKVNQWIDELDSPKFATRNSSQSELARLGSAVVKPLVKALANPSSAEQARRLRRLLAVTDYGISTIAMRRAVSLLAELDTPQAIQLLKELAKQNENIVLKRIAAAALKKF